MKLLTTLKKQLLLLAVLAITAPVFAVNPPDEGMWLPMFIKNYNYAQMQKMGLKLTAEQLYDINNSSLKDAIVQLGDGFCTGEMVSRDGLMFTNHHCGYSSVVELSSVEHELLQFFRESAFRLSHHTLKEGNDRVREVHVGCLFVNVFRRQIILHHEDSHVSYCLGRWCNLNDVTQHLVDRSVHLFHFFELMSKAEGLYL